MTERVRFIAKWIIIRWSLLLLVVLPTACRNSPAPLGEDLSSSELYRLHCSECHGDGSGNGHVAGALPVRPRDFTAADWQAKVTDARLTQVIRDGGQAVGLSEKMPAFKDKLTALQRRQLVEHLRTLVP